jgi:hypothetical protein
MFTAANMLSSGIYYRVKWLSTDFSEVRTASSTQQAVLTSKTSVNNHFTRQYIPEDNSEHIFTVSVNDFCDFNFLLIRATLRYTYKTRTNWKTIWKSFMSSNLSLIKFNVRATSGLSNI